VKKIIDNLVLQFHKRIGKQKRDMQPFCKVCMLAYSLDALSCQSCIARKRLAGVIT